MDRNQVYTLYTETGSAYQVCFRRRMVRRIDGKGSPEDRIQSEWRKFYRAMFLGPGPESRWVIIWPEGTPFLKGTEDLKEKVREKTGRDCELTPMTITSRVVRHETEELPN